MGIVVTYAVDEGLTRHEVAARVAVARSLAALKGFEFGGGYEPSLQRSERSSRLYFVPSESDVLSGRDARGPEVAALEAFRADAGLRAVRACSTEAYGAGAAVPAVVPRGARVQFRGVDPQAGPLVKYTVVEPHGTAH